MGQVKSAAGKVEIPSNIKDKVLNGLTDSVFGSLTQTAAKSGGIDQIKAETSPVTALAGKLFQNNVLSGLNLGSAGAAISGLVPTVMGKLSSIIKDQDGDGDIDLNDLLMGLKGGGKSGASGLLGAATSLLGGFLKKK